MTGQHPPALPGDGQARAGTAGSGRGLGALARLIEDAHSTAPARFVSAVLAAADELGANTARVLLIDFAQVLLVPVGLTTEAEPPVPVTGSVPGRAFVTGAPVLVELADNAGLLVATPLLDGVERLGVLELTFDTGGVDEQLSVQCRRFADLVSQYLISQGRCTDELHIARARRPMSLAAQMQWQVLPPLTAHAPAVTVAGQVEPAYHVGGDAFDYAVNHDRAHVAVFDAMGHGVPASVTTALAVGAYRSCRRRRAGLVETVSHLDEVLAQEFPDDRYVTAALGELDLTSGVLHVTSAGHPAPLLLRGRHVLGPLPVTPTPPLGLGLGAPLSPTVTTAALQTGDRVLFVTDGIIDATDACGRRFGASRLADLVERAALDQLPLAELARSIARGVDAYQHGELADDASLLLVQFNGQPGKSPPAGTAPPP